MMRTMIVMCVDDERENGSWGEQNKQNTKKKVSHDVRVRNTETGTDTGSGTGKETGTRNKC